MATMILLTLLVAAEVCAGPRISLDGAKLLAITAAPPITAEGKSRGSVKAAEVESLSSKGWLFRVYATNPCAPGLEVCSSLMGYYSVSAQSGDVRDENGDSDALVNSQAVRQVRARLLKHAWFRPER